MRGRVDWVSLALVALVALGVSTAQAQNKYKLKPGAEGKLCVSCHADFAEKLKRKFVHTPVKTEECTGCHNPHTSNHGKLLSASTKTICATCHDQIIPPKAVSTHQVAVEGNCVKCHDPHASNNKANLLQAGNALCAGCHKTMADNLAKIKFKHSPVEGGCINCHDPHASGKSAHLLKAAMPGLCLDCHKSDSPGFQRQHLNYPIAKANCVSCHNPHGSNTAGILFDTVHAPVASKRCTQCHDPATSATPFKTRRPGFELCRGCHSTMMNEMFSKNRVHWPLVDQTGCMHCHEPHASMQKKREDMFRAHSLLNTAKEVWRYATANQVTGSPTVFKDSLYCGSVDGNLYCMEYRTGRLRWKFETGGAITGSPIVYNDVLYVGSADHYLYALAV